jgi:pimeloyl-ACP methyl ester carboxylesterase
MAYIWYPALASQSRPTAEYFPFASRVNHNASGREAAEDIFGQSWSKIVDGSLRSHAVLNARPATERGGFPVVLFTHGSGASSSSYTAQIENFVSHGYMVVAIDHPNLAGLVLFPDGRIRLSHEEASSSPSQDRLQAMIQSAQRGTETSAEDLAFVLQKLSQAQGPVKRAMDLDRVAAVGHSAGGTVSARACQLSSRIKACVSEDGEVNPVGAFFDYPDHSRFTQPFLLIQIAEQHTDEELKRMGGSRAGWDRYLAHEREQLSNCAPGSYLVTISRPGLGHAAFSDGPSLNAANGSAEATRTQSNLRLTEDLELAFLDHVFKIGAERPLTSLSAPDVKVERMGQ